MTTTLPENPAATAPLQAPPRHVQQTNGNWADDRLLESAPFGPGDVTVGAENEWLAAVRGSAGHVDLPRTLAASNYFRNLVRRAASGDTSPRMVRDIQAYLSDNENGLWENSWVRFPAHRLSTFARTILDADLYADKRTKTALRGDLHRFVVRHDGEPHVRVPVSYLLKLALADVIADTPPATRSAGEALMGHFLNDNTSPETYSFHLTGRTTDTAIGRGIAEETLRRFLLTQLLTGYANEAFGLNELGQKTHVCLSPQTPLRQKRLNDLVADSFYRDLFMSPCLSGWNCGEAKHQYMILCHEVLSRSRLNTMGKLRECGILARNLVTLPTVSNTSLANNGTHITVASRCWTERRALNAPGYGALEEKRTGDLVIKIVEHFLPLMVNTYSAAPARFNFEDFHPEAVLGFLPHELDFTHLRMVWRRWKGKAHLQRAGMTLTPFGPRGLDRFIGRALGLRGDWIPDQRLIDYLIAPLSTDESPALDGTPDNDLRLKRDLAEMGVFDERMVWYALHRQRLHAVHGYCGIEGRAYSQFAGLTDDLAAAADLQRLITALAWQYVMRGEVTHADIPDAPDVESERRQIFFGAAIGLPTFFTHKRTPNRFLLRLLRGTHRIRDSHRYPGRRRVYADEYRRALARALEQDGAALVEAFGMHDTMADLHERLQPGSGRCAVDRLMSGILNEAGAAHPLRLNADTFQCAAERYYGGTLHRQFIHEALDLLEHDLASRPAGVLGVTRAEVRQLRLQLPQGDCPAETCRRMILALVAVVSEKKQEQGDFP